MHPLYLWYIVNKIEKGQFLHHLASHQANQSLIIITRYMPLSHAWSYTYMTMTLLLDMPAV